MVKQSKVNKELEKVKDELLKTTKDIVEKTLPIITETLGRIINGFVKSMEESMRDSITKKLEKKKLTTKRKNPKQEGEKNVDSK